MKDRGPLIMEMVSALPDDEFYPERQRLRHLPDDEFAIEYERKTGKKVSATDSAPEKK